MAQTIYIDSKSLATGDDGSELNPYLDFENLEAGDLDSGGGNVVNIAGDHFLTQTFNGLKNGNSSSFNVYQQWAGKAQARLISGIQVDNNAAYQWTESTVAGEYYLELAGGGDPSLTIDCATVDGYYRGASVTAANRALEQLGADTASGSAPVIGSFAALEFGYGDGDTLGYDTFYFKPESGLLPDNYEILVPNGLTKVDVGFNYQRFKALHILFGNHQACALRSRVDLDNCVIGNSEFICVDASSSNSNIVARNCIFTQSHRAFSISSSGTVDAANCVMHNNHLGARISNGAATVIMKNNIFVGGESGVFQQTVAFTTGSLTESNNCCYTRLNDNTNKLSYVSGNWLITDATDIPPYFDTTVDIGSSSDAGAYKRALPNPMLVKVDLHDWTKCDFHLAIGSPCAAAGTPISGLTLDYEGVAYDGTNPAIGIYQTPKLLTSVDNSRESAKLGLDGYVVFEL